MSKSTGVVRATVRFPASDALTRRVWQPIYLHVVDTLYRSQGSKAWHAAKQRRFPAFRTVILKHAFCDELSNLWLSWRSMSLDGERKRRNIAARRRLCILVARAVPKTRQLSSRRFSSGITLFCPYCRCMHGYGSHTGCKTLQKPGFVVAHRLSMNMFQLESLVQLCASEDLLTRWTA